MFLKKIEAARAILAALMLCAGAQAWGQIQVSNNVSLNPDTTFTLHGDYIFVGNTNTAIKDYSGGVENITEDLEKGELTNLKDTSDLTNSSIINSSSAVFTFDTTDAWCDNDSVLYAYLVWTGCSTNTPSNRATISWKINDGTYSELTADREVIVNPDPTAGLDFGAGLYACYADITSVFNSENIRTLGNVKFTVANIETDTMGTTSSKFSGWNLTIVYRQKKQDERNIFIYNNPVFGRTGASGTSGDNISIRYNFPIEYNGIGDIQHSTCAGGAFMSMEQSTNITSSSKRISHTHLFDGGGDSVRTRDIFHDLFSNRIDLATSINQEERNNKPYTRGFDLHTFNIPNNYENGGKQGYRYINKGSDSVTLSASWYLEHHFITNSIIETGVPKVPEIEVVQPKPNVNGSCLDYLIKIRTGVNAENLDSFEINVKLPDYTTGISNFQISGELAKKLKGGGENAFIGINASAAPKNTSSVTVSKPDWVNLRYYNNTNTDIRAVIDTALKRSISKNGEPTFLNIKFNSSIPRDLVNSEVFEFTYTVCVDSAYYAMKSAMTGKPAEITSQTDISVKGEISGIENFSYSNEKSVLDSLNNCELFFGFGDGSGGFGGFGGGRSGGGSGGGGGGRNGQPTRVELSWEFDGSEVPDSIVLDACEDSCLPIGIIKEVLLEEFNYNLDSIVAEEKDMWKDIKRDSLIKITTMSIPDLFRREVGNDTVFSDSSNWNLMHNFWHKDKNLEFNQNDSTRLFDFYRDYCTLDSAVIVDDIMPRIRPVIDMPETYSHLIYYYNDDEENDIWTTENDTCIPPISRTSKIKLVTPYTGGNSQSSSSDYIKVIVNVEEVPMPRIFKDGKEIAFGDTVQYCLGDNVNRFAIVKSKPNYRIFGDTVKASSTEKGDTIFWTPNVLTDTEKIDSFFFVQRNNGGCESDSTKFYIQVLNVEVKDKPALLYHRDTFCRSLAKGTTTEISIAYPEAIKEKREKGLDLRWVKYEEGVIVDTLAENVNSIEVPIDSAGEFTYGVRFFYQGCESDTSEFILTVEDTARTLIVDTIDVCQYYNLSPTEIMGVINTAKDTLNAKDSLMFFKHKGDVKIFDNYTEDKSMKLEDVVSEFNYNIPGLKTFVVRPKTMPTGCLGAPSVVAINVIATDSTAPRFNQPGDSILYCLGDDAPADMTMFVSKTQTPDDKFQWLWYSDTTKTHAVTTFPTSNVKLGTTVTSVSTDSKFEQTYFVTRIDSNNCVSRYSTFKVVVDSAITTCPLIIDTTDQAKGCENRVLEICAMSHDFEDDIVPQRPFPSSNYIIEWFQKDSEDEPCDSTPNKRQPLNQLKLPTDNADTLYYCVRQRTVLGCKGNMLPVKIIIHPNETIKPDLAENVFCQFADSVLVEKRVTVPKGYNKKFYNPAGDSIPSAKAWFTTDEAGVFENNFYIQLENVNTHCLTDKINIPYTVNPQPEMPLVENDSVYLCLNSGIINIEEASGTTTQGLNKVLVWKDDKDQIETNSAAKFALFEVKQKDKTTGCEGPIDSIFVSVENSIGYYPIDEKELKKCDGDTIDLRSLVNGAVVRHREETTPLPSIYKLTGSSKWKDPMSDKEASSITESGRFFISTSDALTGCEFSDTVEVVFVKRPTIESVSDTICAGETFTLTAKATDASKNNLYGYFWENESQINSKATLTGVLEKTDSFFVRVVDENGFCSDTFVGVVTVNPKPLLPVADDKFEFCQNTGKDSIQIITAEFNTDKKDKILQWYREVNGSFEFAGTDLSVSTKSATNSLGYKVAVSQLDTVTRCEGEMKEITIVINPEIRPLATDSFATCAPYTASLIDLSEKYSGGTGDVSRRYFLGNVEKTEEEAKSISVNGKYTVLYTDEKSCDAKDTVIITINNKVEAPQLVGDTIVCQGIGTHTLTANKRGANTASQSFLWHNNGNVTLSDALDINTDDAFENLYFLQAKDTVTGCVSDSVRFSFSIRDSIVFSHIEDILSCETHAVNIAERAVETFVGGTEDKIFEYSRIYENGSVVTLSETAASKVLENGRYVIDVHEKISGCKASDTVNVEFKELPELSVKGELVKCQFENLADLKAEGADLYQWQNMQNDEVAPEEPAANERFPFTDSLMEAMSYKFKLIGATTDRIVCYDSITFDVTVNKKPVALKDSTFRFCQNTGEQVIRFSSEYITSENLKVRWYDADKNVMDGEVLNIATETAQTQTFFASLYSADCESDLAEITVVTDPQIPFSMDESVSVCAPNSFDFEAMAKEKVGFWQIDTIIYSFGGSELDDAKAITEQGNYFAKYIDVNGCEYTGKLFLKVNPIVTAPQLPNDTLYFCQAKTVQELGGKSTITDGIVEWSYLDEILDNNIINTSFANTYSYEYKVRQTDTLTNCSSDFNIVTIVIESLDYTPLTDTVLCPGETLNLANHVNSHVSTENVKIDIWQKNMIDDFKLDNIDKTGTFIIQYSLTSCIKQDSIFVSYFDDIKYKRTPDTAVCFGDDVLLFAQSQTEDAYKFFWNNANSKQDTDKPASFSISESAFVKLTAYDKNGCSVKDSLFVTVNKRPEPIASLDTTIEYCFKAETEVIDVKPTESNTIRWHLPNGESTVSAVKPSSLHSGKFTYSIVQTTPEGCEGDAQHVFVTILDSISERPVMDTSHYCQNSNTEPLAAIVKEDGFTIQWYDNKMNALPNGYLPNSENVGVQTYFATLKKGLCESEPAAKYVVVNAPMKDTPAGGKIDLCQNTGKHTLQTKGSIGATLNWYHTEIDNKREDSISVSTDNVAALEYTYWVSQSDNTGCESTRVPVFVEIHKALTSARLKDTFVCKPSKINYMEILKNNRIDYTVDKVLKGIDKKSAVLTKEISEEDTYLFYLTDGYCDAVDTLTLKSPIINSPVVKVEDKTFCYGDSVSMVAQNVDGVDFRWEMNGESSMTDYVSLKITEDMDIKVVAIDRATSCESEPHAFTLFTYPKQEVSLSGNKNICFGDTLNLLAFDGSDFKWFFDNDTVEGDKLVLAPQKNLNVTVKGIGNNSCPISENFNVNVLPVMNPQILGNDKMLTRNDTSVVLYALPNNDDRFTYHWSFGDGTSDSSFFDNIEHLYSSELVKIGNPFDVTLTVTHEYGCKASVSATVEIDPNFTIPNTFAPDENDPSTWFMKNYEVQIYDRVGILIYEGNDGWDGTYNGAPAFKDTYFYVIPYFVKGDKKFKTGYITLVREND